MFYFYLFLCRSQPDKLDVEEKRIVSYLSCSSRELEGLKGLVIDGRTWIDVDHHAGDSSATEEPLKDPGQFTIPEGHHLRWAHSVDV